MDLHDTAVQRPNISSLSGLLLQYLWMVNEWNMYKKLEWEILSVQVEESISQSDLKCPNSKLQNIKLKQLSVHQTEKLQLY